MRKIHRRVAVDRSSDRAQRVRCEQGFTVSSGSIFSESMRASFSPDPTPCMRRIRSPAPVPKAGGTPATLARTASPIMILVDRSYVYWTSTNPHKGPDRRWRSGRARQRSAGGYRPPEGKR